MKLIHFLVLSLGFTLGWSAAAASTYDALTGSGTVWSTGVSREGGWYDADKNDDWSGDADDCLCYAASASNLIAWWQDSDRAVASEEAPKKLEDIWQTYVRSNQLWNSGGSTLAAINWWISGVYSPLNEDAGKWADRQDPVWKRFYATPEKMYESGDDEILPMALPNDKQKDENSGEYKYFGGYYYDQYGLTQQNLSSFLLVDWECEGSSESAPNQSTLTLSDVEDGDTESIYAIPFATILDESPVSLTIYSANPDLAAENPEPLAHAITLWGVEYENDKLVRIWLTDSDDGMERLFSMSVIMDGVNNKMYLDDDLTDDFIYCQEYGYDVFIAEIFFH